MFTRRDLVEGVARAAMIARGAALPSRALRALAWDPAAPPSNLFNTDPERYWAELRSQWLLAAAEVTSPCFSPSLHQTLDCLGPGPPEVSLVAPPIVMFRG
jgi:hypothetical protein